MQGRVQAVQFVPARPGFGGFAENPAKLDTPGFAQLAIELGMQQFGVMLVDHDGSIPLALSFSFIAWRALYKRDLTVFSGT